MIHALALAAVLFDFESRQAWQPIGERAPMVVCGAVTAERLRAETGAPPARLGGDYWNTPIEIGQQGQCRLEGAGEALSPEFTLEGGALSLLVGGSRDARVSLEVADAQGEFTPRFEARGEGRLALGRVSWDISPYAGARARLRARAPAQGPDGALGILLDDVRLAPSREGAARPAPVWGLADLHTHLFNEYGFGGRVFHGKVYAPGGMAEALHSCENDHGRGPGGGVSAITTELGHHRSGWPEFRGWPRYSSTTHQQAYVDWIKRAWQGGLRVANVDVGNSAFMARAFDIANVFTVHGDRTPLPIDDAAVIPLQLRAAREFVTTGPGREFAEIAETPADARRIVASGKLALVLGVEVESFTHFTSRASLRAELERLRALGVRHLIPIHLIQNDFGYPAVYERLFNTVNEAETGKWFQLRDAYAEGIRFSYDHVPTDVISWFFERGGIWGNSLLRYARMGGAANQGGLTQAGEILIDELMRQGFIIDIDHMSELAANRTLELAERAGYPIISSHTGFRDTNFGSLVTYGGANGDQGFEAHPIDAPFDPRLYGTSDSRKAPNERSRSRAQLERIRKLGGMVGVGLGGAGTEVSWRGRIAQDCDGTSKAFVQNIQYAAEVMGGQGVAIGSDVNGLAGLVPPRFGTDACAPVREDDERGRGRRVRVQAFAQRDGVRYSTPVRTAEPWRFALAGSKFAYDKDERDAWVAIARWQAGGAKPRDWDRPAVQRVWQRWQAAELEGTNPPLERNTAGTRDFDLNLDGMAHYGLLPDFLQDSRNVGLTPEQLAPLFRSAEDYIRAWERIEGRAALLNQPSEVTLH